MLFVERAILAVAFLEVLCNTNGLTIDKADGGYIDLLVAIHKDVPPNETIVENLKVLLQSSSEFLHTATGGLVFIKKVILQFPKTWPLRTTATSSPYCCFSKSDVRVQMPKKEDHGDNFSTKQRRLCGKRGDFIRITTDTLTQLKSSRKSNVTATYTFVQEWAHFRYGVFYEYGRFRHKKYPMSYCGCCEKGKIRWNACSEKIGLNADNPECEYVDDCYATEKCKVYSAQVRPYLAESSIMFLPRLENVKDFCNSDQKSHEHNRKAPNMHNHICRRQPTWDVIIENEDFKDLPPRDMFKSIRVEVQEVQQKPDMNARAVLVLDISQSMEANDRIQTLKDAVDGFLLCLLDDMLQLGIVTFSTDAQVEHAMMTVNKGTRKGFRDSVKRIMLDYMTCIGCGLQQALEVLNSTDTPGGTIVLLTDGEENVSPFIDEVIPQLVEAKVEVITMALGEGAEEKVEKLAAEMKGKTYFFPDSANKQPRPHMERAKSQADEFPNYRSEITTHYVTAKGNDIETMVDGTDTTGPYHSVFTPHIAAFKADVEMPHHVERMKIYNFMDISRSANTECFPDPGYDSSIRMQMAFLDSINVDMSDILKPIFVMSETKRFTKNLQERFILDDDLGKNTIVTITHAPTGNYTLKAWLVDPTGQRCQNCEELDSGRLKVLSIPSPAKPGTWMLQVKSPDNESVIISMLVTSQAKDPNNNPIVAVCEMSEQEVRQPEDAVILVDVSKGDNVVLDASVTAVVINAQGLRCPVRLRDDGNVPDLMENDGTYSGYFTHFTGQGRYSVTAYVYGDKNTRQAYRRPGFPAEDVAVLQEPTRRPYTQGPIRRAPADYKFKDTLLGELKLTPLFQRVTGGTSFKVTSDLIQSVVPPGRIWDFKAIEGHVEIDRTPMVRLAWTWPGAHLTYGKAAAVEIRGGTDEVRLEWQFRRHRALRNVVKGNLDPLTPGSTHDVTIALPREWATTNDSDKDFKLKAYLAARVVNADGLKSELSDTVSAEFEILDFAVKSRTTAASPTTLLSSHLKPEPEQATRTPESAEPGPAPAETATEEANDPRKSEEQSLILWILLALVAVVVVMTIMICLLLRMKSTSIAEDQSTFMKTGATALSQYTAGFP